jgi:hypothetical protein
VSDLEECIHGLGPVSACTVCNGRQEREAKEHAEIPCNFPAKYESQCPACNLPIVVGQIVAWLPERRATHEGCWTR